jgi:hypothetical protein
VKRLKEQGEKQNRRIKERKKDRKGYDEVESKREEIAGTIRKIKDWIKKTIGQ